MKKQTASPIAPTPTDYKNLVDLMAIHCEATARLGELENDLQQAWLDLVDARRADYTAMQEAHATSADAIEILATIHPEWFEKTKTLKTPYGTVAFRSVTKLEIKNEEVTILLIERLGEEGLPFIRTKQGLNLEALEYLEDKDLHELRIKRVTTESCSVKPAKIDLGKAVAATSKEGGTK